MKRTEAKETARRMNEYVDGYNSFVMIDRYGEHDVITFRDDVTKEERIEYADRLGYTIISHRIS